jgi:hypothetical protein
VNEQAKQSYERQILIAAREHPSFFAQQRILGGVPTGQFRSLGLQSLEHYIQTITKP